MSARHFKDTETTQTYRHFAKYDTLRKLYVIKPLYIDSAADDLMSSRRFQGDVGRKKVKSNC